MPLSRKRRRKRRRDRGRLPNRHALWPDPLGLDALFDLTVAAAFRSLPPPVLYQYTTWGGFEGILQSQRFWATSHDCTNDKREIVAADDVIIQVAKEILQTATGAALAALRIFIRDYGRAGQVSRVTPIYLSCFSGARDDADQWRDYGDGGQGVCLGVRVGLDEPAPSNDGVGCELLKVDYVVDSWRTTVKKSFLEICTRLEGNDVHLTRGNVALGLSALYRIAAFAAISAKQPQSSVEQEYRLVAAARKGPKVPA